MGCTTHSVYDLCDNIVVHRRLDSRVLSNQTAPNGRSYCVYIFRNLRLYEITTLYIPYFRLRLGRVTFNVLLNTVQYLSIIHSGL